MNKSIFISGLLLTLALGSCYKDKGNYGYKDVNDFEVTVTPAPADKETNIYLVNQPGATTETFLLTAEGKQTLNNSEENLEYIWYRTLNVEDKKVSSDTITGKENLMELPATKKSKWQVLLVVRDKSLDIEHYSNITVKTKVPFTNSWLFVHGAAGERKIGCLSWDVAGKAEITPDIQDAMGRPGYPNMTGITYSAGGAQDYSLMERLFITSSPDSITYIFPFDCKKMGDYREMNVPANVHVREVITPNVNSTFYVAMISTEGKYYYSTSWGTPMFEQPQGDVSSDYSIDLAYMDSRGDVTLWDDTHKRLMNCIGGTIGYMGTVDANALAGKKALWLGRDAKTSAGDREPCLFIAKNEHNNKCYLYHISYDDKGDKMAKGDDSKGDGGEGFAYGNVTCDSTHTWGFDESTLFAVSDYYQDQFFFTKDNVVYRGIMASGESIELYELEGTIKKIAFRYANQSVIVDFNANQHILALVVTNTEGHDEIHEIHLNNGGDVEKVEKYALGDITIIDWEFTALNRLTDY